jgi:enamine deaminase RidA (YjgF/YER057c/UK114 family)
MSKLEIIQPEGWARPRGYSNGIVGSGRSLWVAGQIGWDADCNMVSEAFLPQFKQALANVVAIVRAAGGQPSDIARLTIFVTDLDAYRSGAREVGAAYREVMGKHFPAMALVGVAGLVEPTAKVEIEATAVLEEK